MFTENLEEERVNEPLINSSPAILVWQDLAVIAKKTGKMLLKQMNGKITGGVWAVMGPSGSGKSTLLNSLACRLDHEVVRSGDCRLNGRKYGIRELKAMSCYVMQEDVLNGYLTVNETLLFTAELRMAKGTTKENIKKRVDEVILNMELTETKHTMVGNSLVQGISGGEKKRLCIAMELLTRPKLLFLDEPTSGLDSVTAFLVCQKLKELGNSGKCTVVCTIHQPQTKIFNLFDFILLLKDGNIVYQGPSGAGILSFFEKSGFSCPQFTNPADFLLDVITPPAKFLPENKLLDENMIINIKEIELKEQGWKGAITHSPPSTKDKEFHHSYIPQTPDYMNRIIVNLEMGLDKTFISHKEHMSWIFQYFMLMKRCMIEYSRRINNLIVQIFTSIFMALIIGFVFFEIGNDQTSVSKRNASLFFVCINQGVFVAIQTVNTFPSERYLTLRERKAGTYNVSAYFLAKMTADFFVQLINPIIFSVIVYYLIGFDRDASKFFNFMIFMILCNASSVSVTVMVTTLCRTSDQSVAILPIVMELSRLFGGYFLSPAMLPSYFSWIDALSYVKYAYIGVSLNELSGLNLICTETQLKKGICPITNGEYTINLLGMNYITKEQAAAILVLYIVGTRVIAYLGIRYLK